MSRKLTINFVKSEFEKEGWTCVSDKYVNNRTPLNYICSKGHHGSITWGNWQQGKRCLMCAGHKKHTIEFIRDKFEREKWKLVSTQYVNAHQKLDYVCPEGHIGSITWNDWRRGYRCSACAGNKKHIIEFVAESFVKDGYKLMTTEYINAHQKLDYMCPKGHLGSITWEHWKRGQRCYICYGNKEYTIELIQSEFEKEGWILTSKEYINSYSTLNYICPEGHKGKISWDNWKQGHRCSTCYFISRIGSGHWNWQGGISKEPYCQEWTKDLKEFIKQRDGYKCMNPCCNSKYPDGLCVHHIEYNKKLCDPKDLITTCKSCNPAANFDREWHEAWYKAIMYRRYGYTYE